MQPPDVPCMRVEAEGVVQEIGLYVLQGPYILFITCVPTLTLLGR